MLSRNTGTEGEKSLWFEVGSALRFHSTHPAAFAAISSGMF
jgi:hypothetical protein